MIQPPEHPSHAENLARRYAPLLQPPLNSLRSSILFPSSLSAPSFLTRRNFEQYKALHGDSLPKAYRMESWLDGVVQVMKNGDFEDPMYKSWDLDSDPELRVVDEKDRPDDEWDGIAWQRNLRKRARFGNRRGGGGSDRYA